MQLEPDVEAVFEFVGDRKEHIYEGYRPAHLVKEDYLTTGLHHYYSLQERNEQEIKGTITFLCPEHYPACLWVGKKLAMYEGATMVGYATITKIWNPVLKVEEAALIEAGFPNPILQMEISATIPWVLGKEKTE